MSIHDIKISGLGLFGVLAALALITTPACARDTLSWNNKAETLSEAPAAQQASEAPMALAAENTGPDALAGFGPSSGTVVGDRASSLRNEVSRLRASVNLDTNEFTILRSSGAAGSVQYHSTVAAITARLQNGTTKGNPILLRQWEEASSSLGEVTTSLSKLNSLQVAIDSDASVASYLLGSIQAAFDLSGAVDEDHDQLKLLRDEVNRLVVQLDYLRNQTTSDIQRQSNYLMTERANIQALAFAISRGELIGNSMANRPAALPPETFPAANQPAPPQSAPVPPVTHSALDQPPAPAPMPEAAFDDASKNAPVAGRLLVLIRYNQPHVEYEQKLGQAVNAMLDRRPNAEFSIVAVTPANGNPTALAEQQRQAIANADDVKRSLVQLGLSPAHLAMANMQSPDAQTPEVHVYVH